MTIKAAVCTLSSVGLIVSATAGAVAHEIVGVQSHYTCQPELARAFLRSPNPGAGNQDYPLVVVDGAGNPTGEHIIVMTAQNASDFDARVMALGFAWEADRRSFALVELFRTYNQLTTNVNGVRTGTIGPSDYAVVPAVVFGQAHGDVAFSVGRAVGGVPGFPHTTLTLALVTGNTFAGGKPSDGLAPDAVRHVLAVKGVVPLPAGATGVPDIEGLLDASYVRFRQVGSEEDGSDTGIWRNLLPPVSCR
jgi:hypothetical protein